MPSANFGDSRFRIDYSVSQIQQDVANNRSYIRRVLVMVKQGSSYAYSGSANSWSSTGPTTHSGGFTFNFGNYSSLLLMDHYEWVSHNADGTKSFTSAASVSADLPNGWDSASTSQAVYLTTIPRATTPKLPTGVSGLTTGVAQTIELPRASAGFTHDVTWKLGSKSGTVATGAGTSATVTLPHTVMTELPNAVSGNVTFTTVTKSGATVIGTNNTSFLLTAAASVVPTVTSVLWDDQNTTVKTNIGAFVQGLSLVKGTVTAAGVQGSTISSRNVVVSGNTFPDNTVFQVDGSGTIVASGIATDTRGRSATKAANFTVLPYEAPKIGANDWSVKRANSSNVADDNGQYLRIDLHAIAKSLKPSTVEKNALNISVRTRPTNGAWTNRNVINPGLTHNTSFQVSGGAAYLVSQSYEVEISLSDNTGISPVVLRTTIGTTIVTLDLRDNRVGIGKMHEFGTLDVAGDIYAGGTKVSVVGHTHTGSEVSAATETARGTVERATQAEVNVGTDTTRYVSPKTLHDTLGRVGFKVPLTKILCSSYNDFHNTQTFEERVEATVIPGGPVILSGLLALHSGATAGVTFLKIDPAYAPEHLMVIPVENGDASRSIRIWPNGDIQMGVASIVNYVSLDGVAYIPKGVGTWTPASGYGAKFEAWDTATFGTPSYWKDEYGFTWFRGCLRVKGATPVDNDTMFSLPAGIGCYGTTEYHVRGVSSDAQGVFGVGHVAFKWKGFSNGTSIGSLQHISGIVTPTEDAFNNLEWSSIPNWHNAWKNYGSTYPPARFLRRPDGMCVMSGLISTGNIGTASFLIPDMGVRTDNYAKIFASVSSSGRARIDFTGSSSLEITRVNRLFPQQGAAGWFSLDGKVWSP